MRVDRKNTFPLREGDTKILLCPFGPAKRQIYLGWCAIQKKRSPKIQKSKVQKSFNVALVLLRDKSILVGAQYKKRGVQKSKKSNVQKSSYVTLVLLRDKSILVGKQYKKKRSPKIQKIQRPKIL